MNQKRKEKGVIIMNECYAFIFIPMLLVTSNRLDRKGTQPAIFC